MMLGLLLVVLALPLGLAGSQCKLRCIRRMSFWRAEGRSVAMRVWLRHVCRRCASAVCEAGSSVCRWAMSSSSSGVLVAGVCSGAAGARARLLGLLAGALVLAGVALAVACGAAEVAEVADVLDAVDASGLLVAGWLRLKSRSNSCATSSRCCANACMKLSVLGWRMVCASHCKSSGLVGRMWVCWSSRY